MPAVVRPGLVVAAAHAHADRVEVEVAVAGDDGGPERGDRVLRPQLDQGRSKAARSRRSARGSRSPEGLGLHCISFVPSGEPVARSLAQAMSTSRGMTARLGTS